MNIMKKKFKNGFRFCLVMLVATLVLILQSNDAFAQEDKSTLSSTWELNLPEQSVSRRVSRHFYFEGQDTQVLADIKGPGCIRRFWITGVNIGRDVILRIYFDGVEVPYVEAPLTDFFGAMHNMMRSPYPHDHTRTELPDTAYTVNTPLLSIKPKNGMTAYFSMPFASNAKVEITGSDNPSELYYLIDWHEYPGQEMKEKKRFAARWRREAPVRDYADEFIILDTNGPGQLIGFVHSVDMLQDRYTMRWSHAGADNIYIDGDGDHPSYMRGIGGEDSFGTSYGGGDYLPQSALYSDMPFYVQKKADGSMQKLVGYRFFVNDAIHFKSSLHMRFGSRAHDIATTVYWYTEKPVRPFYTMPPREQRLPGSEVRRGEYDLPLPETGQWWVTGPFTIEEFNYELPSNGGFNPGDTFQQQPWKHFSAIRGFVDFNHIFRPDPSNRNSPSLDATAVARATLISPKETKATLTLAWDDQLVIRVNDGERLDLGNHDYIQSKTIEVPLKKGPNNIAISLSNQMGLTRGTWLFSFRAITSEGEVLLPVLSEK